MFSQVHQFVQNQMCIFTEELIRSILVSNDVSEYNIREILTCHTKSVDSKSSFRSFRKNQLVGKQNKENTDDGVILVVWACLFQMHC